MQIILHVTLKIIHTVYKAQMKRVSQVQLCQYSLQRAFVITKYNRPLLHQKQIFLGLQAGQLVLCFYCFLFDLPSCYLFNVDM